MTDRGVSEVLGFVLVFALVTSTIGVVYASGFVGLADVQHAEQLTNMERAFDVLDDNLADVHRRGAPSRATELKLPGGAVGAGSDVELTVFAANASNTSQNVTYRMTTNPIVYQDGRGTEIVYSMGAVLRSDGAESVMLSRPHWVNDSSRAVVPFVVTFPRGESAQLGGNTKLLLVARRASSTLHGPFTVNGSADVRVDVTIDSPRVAAWQRFLEDRGFTGIDTDASDGNVTYRFHTDVLYVPQTSIELEIER